MRQLFRTRYTKVDPGIKTWYGVGLNGYKEIVVVFPENLSSPFKGRSLTEMEVFAKETLSEKLLFTKYSPNVRPGEAFLGLRGSALYYEKVIF